MILGPPCESPPRRSGLSVRTPGFLAISRSVPAHEVRGRNAVRASPRRLTAMLKGKRHTGSNPVSRRDIVKIARRFSAGILRQHKDESHRDD